MAADIKNYLKEKEKRQKSQDDYKKKIRKHRLKIVYRVLLVVAALGAALALVVVQAKRHIYTGYDTVSSTSREVSSDATDIRLKGKCKVESDLCDPGCEDRYLWRCGSYRQL